jgi:hypothetical protein
VSEGRELTRLVILDGVVWPAGSVPPAEVAKRIRNPKCWEPVENDPPLPWGPEGRPGPATTPVSQARPGLPIGRDPDEPSGQALAAQQDAPAAEGGPEDDKPGLDDQPDKPAPAEQQAPVLSEPPRSGKGATTAAWLAYARQFGIDVPAGADRGQIVALLEDDGHIQ